MTVAATRAGAFDDTDEQQLSLLADSLSSALRHADDAARTANLLAERTAALTALQASETRFQVAFDNSPLGLTLASVDPAEFGRYLHANPAMTRITGYSTAELSTMTFRDLQHPDDVDSTADLFHQLIDGTCDIVTIERRYRHKDSHTVWVTVAVAIAPDEHGAPRYAVDQVKTSPTCRAALAQLQRQATLLELIPATVLVRDLDGPIRWWNRGAEELYGWALSAATGESSHRLLATRFPHGSTAADLTRTLREDGRWDGQLDHVTADGRTVTVLSRQVLHLDTTVGAAQPAAGADLAGSVLEINTDVTAERAAERALAASGQRFKGQFSNSAVGQIIRALDGTLLAVNPAYAALLGHTPEQLIGGSSMGDRWVRMPKRCPAC
ncbi:PAS domain-containing protein [Dactylosporangium sp. CS-047395]|uniref:PAS domain-containing protein n=1 Tax=Dactylosporangium sp. CS-047395 TaxID=3239936 RepID=UPI003D8D28ED